MHRKEYKQFEKEQEEINWDEGGKGIRQSGRMSLRNRMSRAFSK